MMNFRENGGHKELEREGKRCKLSTYIWNSQETKEKQLLIKEGETETSPWDSPALWLHRVIKQAETSVAHFAA